MKGAQLVVKTHRVMKVGPRRLGATGQGGSPFHEQADGEPTEYPQHLGGIAIAHPAFVFSGAHIEPLMQAVLDAPTLAIEIQPVRGVEPIARRAAEQMHRLCLAITDIAA